MSSKRRSKNVKVEATQPSLDISEAKALDVADTGRADVTIEPAPVLRIESEEQAIALVKDHYTVPAECNVVLVTEDRNVFWKQNEGAAVSHAQRNNLKLFRLQWD